MDEENFRKNGCMDLHKAALQHIDRNLEALKEVCAKHRNSHRARSQTMPFDFHIKIDPSDLLEADAVLGSSVLHNYLEARSIFQEVLFHTISALDLLPSCVSQSQLLVNLCLVSLPTLPEYQLLSAAKLASIAERKSFVKYDGIVCGLSTLISYTKSARFVCTNNDCEGSQGNKFVRLHIPGASEMEVIRNDFACSFCGSALDEDVSCRQLADKLVVELFDGTIFENSLQVGDRLQSVVFNVRDGLTNKIDIGKRLSIIGIPNHDKHGQKVTIEMLADMEYSNVLPRSIIMLRKGDVTPAGTFLHLKLGLLLSVVSPTHKNGIGQDLLVISDNTSLVSRLLRYAASLANRSIIHSAHQPLAYSVVKDKHDTGSAFIEGGSLLLASGGVCFVPDIKSLPKQGKQTLFQVLETGKVTVELPHTTGHQMFYSSDCKIWSVMEAAQPKTEINPLETLGEFRTSKSTKSTDQTFINVFGMVITCGITPESYAEFMTVHQILLSAMEIGSESPISKSDFKEFISFVSVREVKFSPESERIIKGYYVASRRIRSTSLNTPTFPVTAVNTLTCLAEAHAKLNLCEEVTKYDALIAVLLYEESIVYKTGYSALGISPLTHITDNNIGAFIGAEMDKKLYMLLEQLDTFILNHAPDLDIDNFPEE